MNRLFAVRPLLVITAALAIALVLACGRGETTSPGSLLRLLPQNADSFTFADMEQLRDERLDNLEQQLASFIGEGRLDDWGIDLNDASSLVLSDPDSRDALTILRGRFVAEDVEDALDDDGLRDSVHRDVTVWSERRGVVALAFVGEDVIVIGEEERVEDSIDVFIDEARSMEEDDEAETIADALEDALVYSVAEDCSYRGCRRQGSAVRVDAGDLVAVFAFLFRNDDAAADAERDIEDDLEDLVDDPRTEADGEMVIAESPVDEDQLGLDRNGALAYRLEGDGSTPGRGGEERPAPAPERPRLADDHGDDRSGATRIRDGEFLDGDIERDGDRDFFFFSAERGREYRIETYLGSNSDTVLVLYGPDGGYLVEDDDSGDSGASRLEWVAPSSDTYYIEVSGFESTPGTYQLSLSDLGAQPPDDHGDDRSGATRIRDGEFLDGDIELDGDRDFFSFSAERGREYRIETHLGFDTVLVLYGPDGDYLVEDDDSGDSGASRLEWVAPSSDTYYIEVSGFESTTGTYQLSLSVLGAQPPDDHGDDRSGATRIRDGEFLDGDIERDGDRDFFFFSAERGREYRLETHLGVDTVLLLYGPDGDYLVEDDDSGEGGASLLEWVAPSSDTYYIEVSGFSGMLGTYQLSLSALGAQPPDDHGDDRSGATRIRDGEFLSGDIELDGDRDFFFFSAERGREYRIETHLGSNGDTVLVLYGPDGGYLVEDDDSGDSGASLLEWVAPSSDTYYIEVSGFDGTPGTYQLSLSDLGAQPPDDHGDGLSGATHIRDGEFLSGDIELDGDRDFFFFSAERGREYRIKTHLGSNDDTVLFLYGPDGGYLDENDDSGDSGASRLEWVAPSSDTYYIEVSGFDGTPGTYQLSLLELGRPATEVNAIGPGETVEGRIGDEEDRGYFEFSAQRGREYVIETHLGSISDTVLVLTGPGGLRLADDDSGDGAASRMYWTAPESDEYLIEVKGFDGATGSYALSLTELERDPTLTPPRRDARYGGELVLALAEEPFEDGFSPRDNFSAGASQIYSLIFSRLWRVSPDSTGGVELDLVEWWEVSEDGRTWTVGLRQDARFHDGRRVTARDAEYSIEAFSLVDFAGVSVIDDYTLRIEFEEPNIGFVNTMASSWRAIVVPRGLLDAPIGRFTDLVGSGPFVPAEHNRNSVSTVGRNPDYYEDGLPFLDTVSLYVAPERTTRYAAFQAGEFHFLGYPYSRTSSGHFPPLTNQEHARVSRNAAFGTYPVVFALWFDTRDLPFSDPRVRLAVNRVIDRSALDSLWAAGEPQGPVPEALFPAWRTRLDAPREGPRELNEWNRYDPEMARQLLAEAGYPDGFATSIQVRTNAPQTWRDLAASIGEMLADVGIYADVVESDFNAPTEWGIKLSPVGRFGQDIDRFFIEHFGSGGEYNYSHTRLDPPDLNSIIGLHQELVEQVYYIPLPALLYARSESVRGPLWAELYDLGTTLRHVWLER